METRLGAVINMALVRELGPVLAATMLAGRVGSSMAAELGTISFWVRPFAAIAAGFLGDYIKSSRAIMISFLLLVAGSLVLASGLLEPGAHVALIDMDNDGRDDILTFRNQEANPGEFNITEPLKISNGYGMTEKVLLKVMMI